MILNYIWVGFFAIAFLVGIARLILFYAGNTKYGSTALFAEMMTAAFDAAQTAVIKIGLPMVGVITLFMGLMAIGEKSGVVNILSRLIGPFFQRLFPGIPKGHPAQGSIMMNFAANMLGLDNAATPMGLKAMQEMQELNPEKDTASDAQIMFLVLNTSGLTLIPINIMAQRAIFGAKDPSDIFIPLLIATFFSTLFGLIYVAIKQRVKFLDPVFLGYLLGISLLVAGIIAYFVSLPQWKIGPVSGLASNFFLLTLIVSFLGLGMYKKVNVFETFIDGAKDGFNVVIKLIPYLVGLLVGIALFRVCGALDFLKEGIRMAIVFVADIFGYTVDTRFVDALPTAFLKPLSGGGARSMMLDTMKSEGPDSLAGRLSCIFQGAADTTFFILAVYFGSVGIKKTRYALAGGLIADFAGVIAGIIIAYIFFGGK
jgi:spore maturation protein SpmA